MQLGTTYTHDWMQFKDKISQYTIARNLRISPATVHNIIKSFRESGEISMHKREGQNPLLNAHNLPFLKQHFINNQHALMINTTGLGNISKNPCQ